MFHSVDRFGGMLENSYVKFSMKNIVENHLGA